VREPESPSNPNPSRSLTPRLSSLRGELSKEMGAPFSLETAPISEKSASLFVSRAVSSLRGALSKQMGAPFSLETAPISEKSASLFVSSSVSSLRDSLSKQMRASLSLEGGPFFVMDVPLGVVRAVFGEMAHSTSDAPSDASL